MALINYDLFASDSADNCELKNLTALLEQLDFSELINEILIRRKGRGRRDWPIEAMLNAVFAIDILQHRSVSGFVRELKRNPALMHVLGFPMRRGFHTDPAFDGYAVPSDSAFCRFIRLLTEIERGTGALMRVFEAQVDEIAALLPDFGKSVGYDGKAVESHSTGRPLKHKAIDKTTGRHPTSDPDASWGVHEQYGTDQNGREVRKTKKWFGYTLHTHGDVTYELPIRFRLETARESEYRHCEGLIEEHEKLWFFDRCRSFVADRGLDSNQIRKRLFKNDILPVIDTRRMWQDVNLHPQQLKVPTRPLDESKVDTILRTENGSLYCQCPQSRELRRMHYQGREQKRGTLKWACPAASYDFTCKGQAACYRMGQVKPGSKSRVVRVKMDPDHLRNYGPLPPNSYKWRRHYDQRSAMERIYSRVDQAHLAHDHFLRGKARLTLKFTVGYAVMLARACVAVKAGQPEKMRSWASSLAA